MISIAICDDEAVFAEALHAIVDAGMKEILYGENSMDERELSYEITVFTNPLMMIDALKTKRFDLAFLDLLMNKESGFGVAQEIRRMRLNTEIAIVTSYGEARNDAFQYRLLSFSSYSEIVPVVLISSFPPSIDISILMLRPRTSI